MGLIKEPKEINFTIGEKRMTKADKKAFSDYFKKLKGEKKNN